MQQVNNKNSKSENILKNLSEFEKYCIPEKKEIYNLYSKILIDNLISCESNDEKLIIEDDINNLIIASKIMKVYELNNHDIKLLENYLIKLNLINKINNKYVMNSKIMGYLLEYYEYAIEILAVCSDINIITNDEELLNKFNENYNYLEMRLDLNKKFVRLLNKKDNI